MLRMLLDTNVPISGILFSGSPSKMLAHWRKDNFTTVTSKAIIFEDTKVAEETSKKFPVTDISEILELFILNSEIFDTPNFKIKAYQEPNDNKFIECVIEGRCGFIK